MFSVIFDMDGTLLDTQSICIPAWEYAGRKQGITGMGNDIRFVCGMNEFGWTNFIVEKYPILDIDLFKNEMRQYIIENLVVKFKKGGREILEFLKKNNVKIAVASGSSRGSVEHHFNEVGAMHFFDALVCGKEVENGKPAPDIFLKAAELLGEKPENCFVFEDSENGIKAGVSAGMKCIGIADVAEFSQEVKNMMFACLDDFLQAIPIFERELKNISKQNGHPEKRNDRD